MKDILALKNKHLSLLYRWLSALQLESKESRERTRFLDILEPRIAELDKVRQEILKGLAKKDKKGEPLKRMDEVRKSDGTFEEVEVWDLVPKALETFTKEYDEYLEEEFVVDILEGNKAKVNTVKNLILTSNQKFSGEMAKLYDEWCSCFEALDEKEKTA